MKKIAQLSKTLSYWLPIFLLINAFPSIAQDADSVRRAQYIQDETDYMALKLGVTNNTDFFSLNSSGTNFTLYPNTELKTKLFFAYRFVQFSLSFAPGFLPGNNDEADKGKSKIFSFGTSVNLDHWIQRLSFDKISGFYVENADYAMQGQKYILFPDLRYLNISGNTAYRFNPNFSFLALESQTERQLKSAGSFMPILSYRYYGIDDRTQLTGANSTQKSSNFETNLSVGYFYTYVINRKLYFSAGAAAGAGMIWTKLHTRTPQGEITSNMNNPIFRTEAMASLGYDSDRFFTGIQAMGNYERYDQNHSAAIIKHQAVTAQVFVGYRFNAPKFLKKTVESLPLK